MSNNNRSSRTITYGGIIAALYIILTAISNAFGLASGMIQLRLSEALCILPCFFPEAIFGIAIGCLISNVLTGAMLWDVVFGTLATLIGALGTYKLRANRWLAALPPIIANTLIIPPVLAYGYGVEKGLWVLMLTVGAGEFISVFVLGELLYSGINKRKLFH
ncbi:MAG: QueT transporter family protein [Clostridiales bacterium]|nr:QueT transporter family protein [Candidatus Crickella caballi]